MQQDKTSTTYRIVYRRIASIFLLFFPASAAATVFVVCLFYLFYFASTLVAFDSTRLPLPSAKCTKRKKGKETFYNNPSHEANSHVSFPPPLSNHFSFCLYIYLFITTPFSTLCPPSFPSPYTYIYIYSQ